MLPWAGTWYRALMLGMVWMICPSLLAAQQVDTIVTRQGMPPRSEASLTLDEALREAHQANARLPVAALAMDIARASVQEVQASRFPRLWLLGGVNAGGPLAYTTSQGQIQLVAGDTLFSGGLRRANLAAARFRLEGAGAGFRIAEKDVDLEVTLFFAEFLRAEDAIALRQQGIDRLSSYLSQIQGRKAAGHPVGSDVLATQVRLGAELAALADAERALDEARLQLNDLLGREPDAPLSLAPLPPPALPGPPSETPWATAPDVREAAANTAIAQAGVSATRSERQPQLEVSANVGALPVFGKDAGTGPNSGSGVGAAIFFSLSWALWDAGVYRARFSRARLQAEQARAFEAGVRRQVRLSYQLAIAQLTRLYAQVDAWSRNVPIARDAYLQAQSIYNGGSATALEVLEAYTSWINANEAYADAVFQYRQAEANSRRWGTP
jgi:outer membrane protein TolC